MIRERKKTFDFILLLTVLILVATGIVMVLSASTPTAQSKYNDIYYYFKKQLIFAAIGFAGLFFLANFDYRKLRKFGAPLLLASIALLVLVLIPGIGQPVKDTWRWILIAGFQFQPSEVAKFALILFLAGSLAKRQDTLKYFWKGFFPYLIVVGVFSVLIMLEPHLSCTIIIVLISLIMLFSAGAKKRHFLILTGLGAGLVAFALKKFPYMLTRVTTFLDPWKYAQDEGWQIVQSLYAIGSGGLFGKGLGRSLQKYMYLPEPHNDFIFSVIAEELGFIGVTGVLLLFGLFIWRGIKISLNASDSFGSLLAAGITSLIAIQTILNIGVVTASIPATGVALPFFSAGGTALIMFMGEVGILLNISRYSRYDRL
ncbi:MAG: putative lipid II flippase FtsW [Eubacteriales bacterium]|nr:putative lipid II flippase FtsW [Eubacteriales bacterium]